MPRSYDTVAIIYDRLARLVFGNVQVNAQKYLLHAIPAGAHVLIAGGGTGWILEEIAALHPSGLTIVYVDVSAQMMALASKRKCGSNEVTFITAPIEDLVINELFDVVITPFLFDNFTEATAGRVFTHIDLQLKKEGVWLYCDFQATKVLWHKMLLRSMYVFFRTCCGIEATHLPDVMNCFKHHGYTIAAQKDFMKGFISAMILTKDR